MATDASEELRGASEVTSKQSMSLQPPASLISATCHPVQDHRHAYINFELQSVATVTGVCTCATRVARATSPKRTIWLMLDFFGELGGRRNRLPAEHMKPGQLVCKAFNRAQRVAECQFAFGGPQTGVLSCLCVEKRNSRSACGG